MKKEEDMDMTPLFKPYIFPSYFKKANTYQVSLLKSHPEAIVQN